MPRRLTNLLMTATFAASVLFLTGCDFKSTSEEIYDDVGETDYAARERLYLKKVQERKEQQRKLEEQKKLQALPLVPRVEPRPAALQAKSVPAPAPEYVGKRRIAESKSAEDRVRHHYSNVGEIEVGY